MEELVSSWGAFAHKNVLTHCSQQLPATAKFCLECGQPTGMSQEAQSPIASPYAYTPQHLAQKILHSNAALEGERKQVTVLFADLKGSMGSLTVTPKKRAGSSTLSSS
jgi:hypothetical protein